MHGIGDHQPKAGKYQTKQTQHQPDHMKYRLRQSKEPVVSRFTDFQDGFKEGFKGFLRVSPMHKLGKLKND
ncbi:hypothetical protein [Virgibacillus alimentarius]|uniref:Uncharacterized protein n=1 Tax=Virgibacillus alimentarius TaxID=698769 RepID=A0ABS4SC04_9BACI|nr:MULTISPECIES: hypothetical protein [Virgibacillus]MBP2258646.1 hypothetical protein [Virgibacillus alimentarius]HLR66604.1 hypothetical protein [Virgibacillus sp.]